MDQKIIGYILTGEEWSQATHSVSLAELISTCRIFPERTMSRWAWDCVATISYEWKMPQIPWSLRTPGYFRHFCVIRIFSRQEAHLLSACMRKRGFSAPGTAHMLCELFTQPRDELVEQIDAVLNLLLNQEKMMAQDDVSVVIQFPNSEAFLES